MTDMTPRPLTDALVHMAMTVAQGVHNINFTGEDPYTIIQRAKKDLYDALDSGGRTPAPEFQWKIDETPPPESYEMWRRGQQIKSLVKKLRTYDEVLDVVRSAGVDPADMLRELVRAYRERPAQSTKQFQLEQDNATLQGVIQSQRERLDAWERDYLTVTNQLRDADRFTETLKTASNAVAEKYSALKVLVKEMVDACDRRPAPGFFGMDWNTVVFYVGKLRELLK